MSKWKTYLNKEEIDLLVKKDREIYPLEDCITSEEYLEYLSDGLRIYLLTEDNDKWVGYIQVSVIEEKDMIIRGMSVKLPKTAYIAGIGVFNEYQRKGYGRIIMNKFLTDYSKFNKTLRTRHDNIRMQNLASRCSFTFTHEQEIDGTKWLWYRK